MAEAKERKNQPKAEGDNLLVRKEGETKEDFNARIIQQTHHVHLQTQKLLSKMREDDGDFSDDKQLLFQLPKPIAALLKLLQTIPSENALREIRLIEAQLLRWMKTRVAHYMFEKPNTEGHYVSHSPYKEHLDKYSLDKALKDNNYLEGTLNAINSTLQSSSQEALEDQNSYEQSLQTNFIRPLAGIFGAIETLKARLNPAPEEEKKRRLAP